ncbi:SDR family NAD(P)-dependent oxidoreductase [uncultured Desulfovibrio sp.]|uniref:SDR family NAD(P)-dependent oxidoreductase n=1 Tax=uncultured Desulfovibrio sp. TaxID=167968 RepID=UPI0026159A71|nr:SDR family NAD(P)-dependent oxidoreductase [uncultured Desulfovibrio sp.]
MSDVRPVAIVTGAASNIGRACARRLAEKYTVVLADIGDTTALAGELPHALPVRMDVGDFASCTAAVQAAEAVGPLQCLVHCAGITKPACSIEDMSIEEWQQVIHVDLTGTFLIAKACIPAMRRHAPASMILYASRAGKTGFAALGSNGDKTKAHYCAAKAGVISLVKSLALELAAANIRVNGVAPGPVQGTMIPREQWESIAGRVPLHRLGTPEEMAEAAWFLQSQAANFITGHILDVNGGTLMD